MLEKVIPARDEPFFLIRASDVLGAGIVRLWVEQYRGLSGAASDMARMAWEHAEAMTARQRTHEPKTPDLPNTPAQERDS